MGLEIVFKILFLMITGIFAAGLIGVAIRIIKSDKGEYQRNRERSGSLLDAAFGTIKTKHDGVRDYRVRAGLAVDRKRNVWVEQGILSEEAIDAILCAPDKTKS